MALLQVIIDSKDLKQLKQMALDDDTSVSEIIRKLVRERLAK